MDKALRLIPDIVISDVMMPEMDGFTLCEKLKTDERTSHIPVVLLTARSSDVSKLEGLETGADDYLIKPVDAKELLTRIKNLIEQRRRLRERFGRDVTLSPKDIAVTSADQRFLRAIEIVEKEMKEPDFSVEQFSKEVCMSTSQLYRKIHALTNQSPVEFIRTFRLKRAAYLLEQKFGNVAEIAFEVGFNNLSYFAKCFRELFGKSLPVRIFQAGFLKAILHYLIPISIICPSYILIFFKNSVFLPMQVLCYYPVEIC